MNESDEKLIEEHRREYIRYFNFISDDGYPNDDSPWLVKIEHLMSMWNKMITDELMCQYKSFKHMLLVDLAHLKKMNDEYYVRFGGRPAIIEPNTGGRYWK